jgi:ribosome maturation factor RimP
MSVTDRVRAIADPLVTDRGFSVYDIERHGPILRISVAAGAEGGAPSIDDLTAISRAVSRAVDEDDPVDGRYTLEVSSPGLERPLRTPEHFAGAIGETVLVTTRRPDGGTLRVRGVLRRADDTTITVAVAEQGSEGASDDADETTVALDQIEKARTLFEWGPTTQPGGASSPSRDRRSRS